MCLLADGGDAFRFGKARKTEMARVVEAANGRVKPLTLGAGENLFDYIHLVFFPGGIVGAEFNLVGPKMPELTDYLVSKLTSCMPVAFDRLVYRDVMERLGRLRDIKLIEMRIDTTRSEVVSPVFDDGWVAANRWMNAELGVGTVELTLRAGTTAHRSLKENALTAVRKIFEGKEIRDAADKFRIKAVPDGQQMAIMIDLLDDKLMTSVEIQRPTYRSPDRYKEYMYTKIRAAYSALKSDIMQAARIVS